MLRTVVPLHLALLVAAISTMPGAAAPSRQELAQELIDLERRCPVDPNLTLTAALQTVDPVADRYLRTTGVLTDLASVETMTPAGQIGRLSMVVEGRRIQIDVEGVPDIIVGERVRLLMRVPAARSQDARLSVVGWAPETSVDELTITSVPAQLPSGAAPSTDVRMGPGQVVGPEAPRTGMAGPRDFANPQAAPAGASGQTYAVSPLGARLAAQPVYMPSPSEQAQFMSYVNLAQHFNPRLSSQEAQFGVSRPLVASLVYAESHFSPTAKSPAGAIGLCQLMPGTAANLGVRYPYDISQNVYGGVRYLAQQLGKFAMYPNSQRFEYSMAAYNAGPNAVAKYGGMPPYRETQHYVRTVASMFNTLWDRGYR
jgi:soluble lytic murein transglycosylase-like protein